MPRQCCTSFSSNRTDCRLRRPPYSVGSQFYRHRLNSPWLDLEAEHYIDPRSAFTLRGSDCLGSSHFSDGRHSGIGGHWLHWLGENMGPSACAQGFYFLRGEGKMKRWVLKRRGYYIYNMLAASIYITSIATMQLNAEELRLFLEEHLACLIWFLNLQENLTFSASLHTQVPMGQPIQLRPSQRDLV